MGRSSAEILFLRVVDINLLDYLDRVPNRGTCIDACLSGDVTRGFKDLADIKKITSQQVLSTCHHWQFFWLQVMISD